MWPATRTKSRCAPQTECGTHSFEIIGYSLHKADLGKGESIRSATFTIDGYEWCIMFFPNGDSRVDSTGYVSVYAKLLSQKAKVRASYDCRMLDQTTGSSSSIKLSAKPNVFDTSTERSSDAWGYRKFMKIADLEASPYLCDDRLQIECDITVIKRSQIADTVDDVKEIHVPPSDLPDDFGKLLVAGLGTDVTFKVKGESLAAHRNVLAARSPVFKAQLYGQVGADNRNFITIEDIEPGIFKALLHFLYTDSLPDIQDIEIDEIHDDKDIAKYLLVAADKYALERLKLVCTRILCKSLDETNVAATLALADMHNCSELRDACIEFITSCDRVGDVAASQGYHLLKKASPGIFIDLWEKVARLT